jgi:site-specific recombinase XerD
MSILKLFVVWVDVPLQAVTHSKVLTYIDWLLSKRLKPKTINCHLACISGFYQYLYHEKGITITNPVKQGYTLRLSKPLPRFVRDEKLDLFLQTITTPRDYAMFMVMLRCGLRVAETAHLTLAAIDLPGRQIMVCNGKGGKDRVVYISNDAHDAIVTYLQVRPAGKAKKLFLVEKGPCRGKPLSVRGIQKRMEYYARKAALPITCHQLRHTMATQLLNADAELASIQDLLGHNKVTTTQRYCKVSNRKVQRDYFKAMAVILHSTVPGRGDSEALDLIK